MGIVIVRWDLLKLCFRPTCNNVTITLTLNTKLSTPAWIYIWLGWLSSRIIRCFINFLFEHGSHTIQRAFDVALLALGAICNGLMTPMTNWNSFELHRYGQEIGDVTPHCLLHKPFATIWALLQWFVAVAYRNVFDSGTSRSNKILVCRNMNRRLLRSATWVKFSIIVIVENNKSTHHQLTWHGMGH